MRVLKMAEQEDPELTSSHGHTEITPIYRTTINKNGEGNGNPLQYSSLENPMDGGAWGYSQWGHRDRHD